MVQKEVTGTQVPVTLDIKETTTTQERMVQKEVIETQEPVVQKEVIETQEPVVQK